MIEDGAEYVNVGIISIDVIFKAMRIDGFSQDESLRGTKGRKKSGFLEDPLWRVRLEGKRASDGKKEEMQG